MRRSPPAQIGGRVEQSADVNSCYLCLRHCKTRNWARARPSEELGEETVGGSVRRSPFRQNDRLAWIFRQSIQGMRALIVLTSGTVPSGRQRCVAGAIASQEPGSVLQCLACAIPKT